VSSNVIGEQEYYVLYGINFLSRFFPAMSAADPDHFWDTPTDPVTECR